MIKRLTTVVLTMIFIIIGCIVCFIEVITMPLCYIIFDRVYWFKESVFYKLFDIYTKTIKLIKNDFTE